MNRPSFLSAATGRGDFGRAHEVANVFLKELVVAVKFVVLFTDCLDAIENSDERFLQKFGMSSHFFPGFFAHLINVLTGSSGTHGSDIVGTKLRVNWTNGRAVAGNRQGAAAFSAGQSRSSRHWMVYHRSRCSVPDVIVLRSIG